MKSIYLLYITSLFFKKKTRAGRVVYMYVMYGVLANIYRSI